MYLAIQTEHPSKLENGAITFAVGWDAKTGGKWPAGNYIIRVRAALTGQARHRTGALSNLASIRAANRHQRSRSHRYHGQAANYRNSVLLRRRRCRAGHRTLYIRLKGTHDHYLVTRLLQKEGPNNSILVWAVPMPCGSTGWRSSGYPMRIESSRPDSRCLENCHWMIKPKSRSFQNLRPCEVHSSGLKKEAFRGKEPGAKFIDGLVRKYETRLSA